MKGEHRVAVEQIIEHLHVPPCPNPSKEIVDTITSDIVDKFWEEFKHFSNQTGDFNKPGRWLTPDVMGGKSHLWHEEYSLPYGIFLGFLAWRTTSKILALDLPSVVGVM